MLRKSRHRPSKTSGIPNKMAENEVNKWFQKLGSSHSANSANRGQVHFAFNAFRYEGFVSRSLIFPLLVQGQ